MNITNKQAKKKHNLNNQEKTCTYLRDVLLFGHIFGLFPLNNILNNESTIRMEFKWKSWKLLYTFMLSIGFLVCFLTGLIKALFTDAPLLIQLGELNNTIILV